MAVAMVFKLCVRLHAPARRSLAAATSRTEWLAYTRARDPRRPRSPRSGWPSPADSSASNALGYSEGLMTALVLIAVDRHLDGRHRQAFAIGFVGRARPSRDLAVLGSVRAVAVLEGPGRAQARDRAVRADPDRCGSCPSTGARVTSSAASRAPSTPRSNSAAFAKCPFCTEFAEHAWPTVPLADQGRRDRSRVLAAAIGLWRAVPGRQGAPRCATPRRRPWPESRSRPRSASAGGS